MSKSKVLLAGESWVSTATHIKGSTSSRPSLITPVPTNFWRR